jgi:transcriptional regulator with XRE-family HTH domain
MLLCGPAPYSQVELQLDDEVRVLGILDLEIRSLFKPHHPIVPVEFAKQSRLPVLTRNDSKLDTRLSHLVRSARLRTGLSFREASAMSREIAAELGDQQFFAAPGSLSDYEARDVPPRHVHKAIALCAIYGLHFSTFLKSIGLPMDEAGTDPIPDRFVPRTIPADSLDSADNIDDPPENGFFGQLLKRFDQLPLFLRTSLPFLSGVKHLSLHDFFWVGGESNPLHPALVNGIGVIVNRHRKKPIYVQSNPIWQQPVYVLLRRDGTYTCGCCSLEGGALVIHPYSSTYQQPERLRDHDDAEVVGQIMTVARRL